MLLVQRIKGALRAENFEAPPTRTDIDYYKY